VPPSAVYYQILYRPSIPTIPTGKYAGIDRLASNKSNQPHYDVAIVGGGPSGSTCGYYLTKAGARVAVLDKETFPRDKICGDAVCKTAIEILFDMQTIVNGQKMSVFEQLKIQNKSHVADSGGLVSPSGISYIGKSHEELGTIPAAIAVKRLHLDEAIARAAQHAGVDLKEQYNVQKATFDAGKGLWTLESTGKPNVTARVLVCADGAQSQLARKLGIVQGEPQGSCTRAFVKVCSALNINFCASRWMTIHAASN
jgi:menaquinone-9 beta-reductase